MTLAVIAGQGDLPEVLVKASNAPCFHLEGFAPEGLTSQSFRVEQLGSFIAGLTDKGVTQVCFAGAIARPKLDPSAIDAATMPLVPRMMQALQAGDDAALRIVLDFFAEAGLEIVAAQDICSDLLFVPQIGTPSDRDRADIARARAVHTALAPLDVGQGCVVVGGQVLAIEAAPGTDWMLASLTHFPAKPTGGVLFKAAKAGQDRRIDMATIGPDTVRGAAAAGLSGIAVVQGDILVLHAEKLRAALAETGLFLTNVTP